MIREILSSDVEFAKGMLDSSRSDTQILACLSSRGIDSAKAVDLLDDLRHGRRPDTRPVLVPGSTGHSATESGRAAGADAVPASASQRRHSHGRRRHKHSRVPWGFILLAAIFILALVYALFEMGSDASKATVDKAKHDLPPPPGN